MQRRSVPFFDMGALLAEQGEELAAAVGEVVRSGRFIGGPVVAELEQRLAALAGARRAVACASGTVAEQIALMALGVGPGDEVLVPDFTFAATAEAVALVGARPVFVDVEPETFCLDLDAARRALGPKVKAVVPVSLFGHPCDLPGAEAFCAEHGLLMVEDTCQSLGSTWRGRGSGSFGHAAYTSFYPAKPLGGVGDGGMIFCGDDELADRMTRLRHHGEVGHHLHRELGTNGRLDAVSCAALLVRLRRFPDEVARRRARAARYDAALAGIVRTPRVREGCGSTWAQYTVRLPDEARRASFQEFLRERGVPTVIHYPRGLHTQEAFAHLQARPQPTPVCDELCGQVVSLPLSAHLSEADQEHVIQSVRAWSALDS